MKKINLLLISTMLIVGCAKKVDPTPEIVETQPITQSIEVEIVYTPVEVVNNTQLIEAETPTETLVNTTEVLIEISSPSTDEDAEEAPIIKEVVETPPTPQQEIKPSFDFDQVFPD